MSSAHTGATAALLADGRVLVAGGQDPDGPSATAELYDGAAQVFSPAASMGVARARAAAVVLSDGRVLVTGGLSPGGDATSAAEIYDPGTDSWSAVGDMVEARSGHTASLLRDGRALIAGGEGPSSVTSTLEIFDPATNAFDPAGELSSPRKAHAAALLADGRVLIVGGSDGIDALSSTDIFDPATGQASPGPALSTGRAGASATTLLNGKVLVAGGSDGASDLASAEVYDPAVESFSATGGGLATARQGHLGFLLPFNNQILIAGGTSGGEPTASAELFALWNDAFSDTGALSEARADAVGSPLNLEGRLLVTGGSGLSSAELYGFATVRTDKADYAPGETVTITGSGWEPGETVVLLLEEAPETHDDRTLTTTADEAGNIFNNEFAPEAHDVGVRFYLTASGARSQAQTTFTDAEIHFTQCRNDSNNDEVPDDCAWSEGAINQNNSIFREGDAVPQRLFHEIDTAGTHTIRFEYDFSKASKYAYDFLTNVDETQSGPLLNECGDLPGFVTTCSALFSGAVLAPIPSDPFDAVSGRENPAARSIRIGGVSSATVTFPSLDGGDDPDEAHDPDSDPDCFQNCGTSSVLIDLTFTTEADDTVVGVWFGGHLAQAAGPFGWGAGFGASSISGAPFHISYESLDGDSAGRRDNQIQPGAVVAPSCPASCDDLDPCTTDTCDESTGLGCAHAPVVCDDGDACNGTETCNPANGECLAGIPVVCPALDECHVGVCDPVNGECSNVNAPDGFPCDDHDACTPEDTCQHGTCVGVGTICGEDPPTMTTVSCNPTTAQRGLVPTQVSTGCTAEVRDLIEAGPFATGRVSFFADGATNPFATCTINGTAQVQTCSVIYSTSVVGPHPIVATYSGDATHLMSTGATVFTVTLRTVTVRVPSLIVASTGLGSPPVSDRPDRRRPRSAWSKPGHSHRGETPDRARLAQLTAVLPSIAPPFHNRSGSERPIRPPPLDCFSDAFSFRG
jgi:hypothetical protein